MQKSSATVQDPKTSAHHPVRTVSILHVDDNSDDRALFHLACKRAKVPVHSREVGTAADAIDYLRRFTSPAHLADSGPQVVVLDLAMPGGSGLTVVEFMRENAILKDIPVVVLSGTVSPSLLNRASRLAVSWVVEKPVSFEVLVQVVREILRRFGRGFLNSTTAAEGSNEWQSNG